MKETTIMHIPSPNLEAFSLWRIGISNFFWESPHSPIIIPDDNEIVIRRGRGGYMIISRKIAE